MPAIPFSIPEDIDLPVRASAKQNNTENAQGKCCQHARYYSYEHVVFTSGRRPYQVRSKECIQLNVRAALVARGHYMGAPELQLCLRAGTNG